MPARTAGGAQDLRLRAHNCADQRASGRRSSELQMCLDRQTFPQHNA
jgi:hypothetical protein